MPFEIVVELRVIIALLPLHIGELDETLKLDASIHVIFTCPFAPAPPVAPSLSSLPPPPPPGGLPGDPFVEEEPLPPLPPFGLAPSPPSPPPEVDAFPPELPTTAEDVLSNPTAAPLFGFEVELYKPPPPPRASTPFALFAGAEFVPAFELNQEVPPAEPVVPLPPLPPDPIVK